ncbi:LytTR family transcriptional regulator DNA-binding domain-containing protein [Spirosoma aerophilum]
MRFSKLNDNTSRITYLMGWGNYTRVFLVDSSPQVNATTLKKCVGTLPGFIRLSKSAAVNPYHIDQVRRKGDRCADVLVAGTWLPVSRRRVSTLVKHLYQLPDVHVKGLVHFRAASQPVS